MTLECPYCQQELPEGFVDETEPAVITVDQIAENYKCGAPTETGTCSRTVDSPEETCFQHDD